MFSERDSRLRYNTRDYGHCSINSREEVKAVCFVPSLESIKTKSVDFQWQSTTTSKLKFKSRAAVSREETIMADNTRQHGDLFGLRGQSIIAFVGASSDWQGT